MSCRQGIIAVDLDGTLAEYSSWSQDGSIGAPVPAMVERLEKWLEDGERVCIFTARVSAGDVHHQKWLIWKWLEKHVKNWKKIEYITCKKTMDVIELWDDRAIQVVPNTGMRADGNDPRPECPECDLLDYVKGPTLDPEKVRFTEELLTGEDMEGGEKKFNLRRLPAL